MNMMTEALMAVGQFFKGVAELLVESVEKCSKLFNRRSGSATELGIHKPLKLNLQFFAENPDDDPDDDKDDKKKDKDPKDTNKTKDDPNKTDPADPLEDEDLTLKELFKKNPKLKDQYSEKFQADFNKRLKGLNLEEARKAVALLEKLGLNAEGLEDKGAGTKDPVQPDVVNKYETSVKDLSLKLYAAKEGLDANLISALASNDVRKLDLNEEGTLDEDDLEEVIDGLREKFPSVFEAKTNSTEKPDDKKDKNFTPGGRQKTNPPPGKPDIEDKMRDKYKNLRKKKVSKAD